METCSSSHSSSGHSRADSTHTEQTKSRWPLKEIKASYGSTLALEDTLVPRGLRIGLCVTCTTILPHRVKVAAKRRPITRMRSYRPKRVRFSKTTFGQGPAARHAGWNPTTVHPLLTRAGKPSRRNSHTESVLCDTPTLSRHADCTHSAGGAAHGRSTGRALCC